MTEHQKPSDITYGDIHARVLSPCSTEEKIALYEQWASGYEEHTIKHGYRAPSVVVNRVQKYMKERAAKMPCHTVIRVLDLGCGTGKCGRVLSELWKDEAHPLQTIGLDFSPEMLALSMQTGTYSEVLEADVSKSFEVFGGPVQFLVASGLFLEGHVSPEAIPFAFDPVEEGGVISISVRAQTFLKKNKEYMKYFEEAHCVVLDNSVGRYYENNADVMANYIILLKTRSTRK